MALLSCSSGLEMGERRLAICITRTVMMATTPTPTMSSRMEKPL